MRAPRPASAAARRTAVSAPAGPGSPAASGRQPGPAHLVAGYAAAPVAVLLWLLSLRQVALDRMGDLGLLQVLPVLYWVAVALLTAGFALCLYDRRFGRLWLTAQVLALVAMIHATPSLLYPTLRYSWAWKHIAVIDAMIRHGGSVPHASGGLDVYNQWPGFFVANGLLLLTTGLHSALGYAAWTPPVVNALLLGPLLLLYRTLTADRRLIWGGAWFFYSCSWVGQDYFSPQAFGFLLYVVLLAVVFRQLASSRARPDQAARPEPGGASAVGAGEAGTPGGGRRGWPPVRLALVLVVEAAIVSSHQLTPLMLITALIALSLPRGNRRITLPPLAALIVMQAVWLATVARPYISANLGSFGKALLSPDGNAVSGLAGLGAAAPGQVAVAWIDRSLSAAVVLLAVICFVRRRWVRRSGLPLVALSPLPLLAANGYGGEMIFRVYLFALPATAFLIAALVLPPGRRQRLRSGLRLLGVYVLMLALLGGLFFGYDSKEEMNYFTPDEVAAARYVTATAPPGATVVAVTGSVPGFYQNYDQHTLVQLTQEDPQLIAVLEADPLLGLREAVGQTPPGVPAYLILSRAQAAECYLTGDLPADTQSRLQAAVAAAPGFTAVFRNADAVVYRFVPVPAAAPAAVSASAPAAAPAAPSSPTQEVAE